MIPYKHNDEIVTFFNKAQNKIAQLGKVVADEPENEIQSRLLLDLSDFLESLDSPYLTWTETDIIRYIHFWNKKAGLNDLPFILMTGYQVSIRGEVGGGLNDTPIYIHNQLSQLQGGNTQERYHLTKKQWEWVVANSDILPPSPTIDPKVRLGITVNKSISSSGYYELGDSITSAVLQGSIELFGAVKINHYLYKRNNIEINGSKALNPSLTDPVNPYSDKTVIKEDTSYSFEALFDDNLLRSHIMDIKFRQPLYFGVLVRYQITSDLAITLEKRIQDKSNLELSFNLPEGNTLLESGKDKTPVLFIPNSWGKPKHAMVSSFDYITDWSFLQVDMKLKDGSSVSGLLGIFNNQIEGINSFNFIF